MAFDPPPDSPNAAAEPEDPFHPTNLPPILGEPSMTRPPVYGKLHPLTILFAAWNSLKGWILPFLFLTFFSKQNQYAMYVLIFPCIATVTATVRYCVFSYRLEEDELITRDGLLEKRERNIPLNRVQDIRLEQGILHRLLGVSDVVVETAGGSGPEASLSVLSKAEAERLRAAVFSTPSNQTEAESSEKIPVQEACELIRQVSFKELVLSGLTSNRMASILVVVFAGIGFLDDLAPEDEKEKYFTGIIQFIEHWILPGGQLDWMAAGMLGGGVVIVAMLFSVAGTVLLFNGFQLFRKGEDLQRSYGLTTRRSSSLPLKRIQIMMVEENWMRRLLHLATIRVDTAGVRASEPGDQNRDGRDVLLPIVKSGELDRMVSVVFPQIDESNPNWQQVDRCMIARATFKAAFFFFGYTGLLIWISKNPFSGWLLMGIPLAYIYNRVAYRHLGYSREESFFRTRRGWFSRSTRILPIRNIQSIVIRQNPFDRRHRVWTLQVDSAGQAFTGGGPELKNVPDDTARELACSLARQAASIRYRV